MAARELGTLDIFPPEIRASIFSQLDDEDYKQTYGTKGGKMTFVRAMSTQEPGYLRVNQTLRNEVLAAQKLGRHCKVQIMIADFREKQPEKKPQPGLYWVPPPSLTLPNEQCVLVTNFPMRDEEGIAHFDPSNDLSNSLSIPVCARIVAQIIPPSPRDADKVFAIRSGVKSLVNIINASARNINPEISIDIAGDRSCYSTMQYSEMAIFLGPFVGLSRRCKASMVSRVSDFAPTDRESTYCELIEQAMSFDADARVELELHQHQIDLRRALRYLDHDGQPRPWFAGDLRDVLTAEELVTVKTALAGIRECYRKRGTEYPAWVVLLSEHLTRTEQPRHLPERIYDAAMDGYSRRDMQHWAAGFSSHSNPFFDDAAFFAGSWKEDANEA